MLRFVISQPTNLLDNFLAAVKIWMEAIATCILKTAPQHLQSILFFFHPLLFYVTSQLPACPVQILTYIIIHHLLIANIEPIYGWSQPFEGTKR